MCLPFPISPGLQIENQRGSITQGIMEKLIALEVTWEAEEDIKKRYPKLF